MQENDMDDRDYWTRNVRARIAQTDSLDPDEFEFVAPDADAPSNVVVEVQRTDDAPEWDEDEWTYLIMNVLQRAGFEVVTNGDRPVSGVHVLPRPPLSYPFAEEDREDDPVTDGGDEEDEWDPQPASLRDGENPDEQSHAQGNIETIRQAERDGYLDSDEADEAVAVIRENDEGGDA
jgi:hypothetical protein